MATLNINGEDDPFYRYKMPAVQVQILGDNTTIITNLTDVAKALNRTPDQILKFLKQHLNTGGNSKKQSVNGERPRAEIQAAIGAYIKKDVLCRRCGNPETVIEPRKKRKVTHCRACGAEYE